MTRFLLRIKLLIDQKIRLKLPDCCDDKGKQAFLMPPGKSDRHRSGR